MRLISKCLPSGDGSTREKIPGLPTGVTLPSLIRASCTVA